MKNVSETATGKKLPDGGVAFSYREFESLDEALTTLDEADALKAINASEKASGRAKAVAKYYAPESQKSVLLNQIAALTALLNKAGISTN